MEYCGVFEQPFVEREMQNLNLPVRSAPSRRNQESRSYFTSYTPPSSTEAINGPVREPVREQPPMTDRLIVGVDFGTTFSGWVDGVLFLLTGLGGGEQD